MLHGRVVSWIVFLNLNRPCQSDILFLQLNGFVDRYSEAKLDDTLTSGNNGSVWTTYHLIIRNNNNDNTFF